MTTGNSGDVLERSRGDFHSGTFILFGNWESQSVEGQDVGGKWCHLPCLISTKILFEPL